MCNTFLLSDLYTYNNKNTVQMSYNLDNYCKG